MKPLRVRLATSLMTGLLLAACAATPDAARPVPIPATWANPPTAGGASPDPVAFWKALDDGLLLSLVERALSGSPSVAQAVERVSGARALQGAADGRFLPAIDFNGTARLRRTLRGEQGIEAGAFQGLGIDAAGLASRRTTGTFEAGFDASWEISLFGRRSATLVAAAANTAAAEAEAGAARTSLASEVGRTYAALRAAEARQEVLLGIAASQDRLLALVRTRRSAGLASDVDVERAAISPGRSRAQAAEVGAGVRRALQRLAVLAGEGAPDPALARGSDAARRQPRIPSGLASRVLGQAVPADLLRSRPEIRRAEAAVMRAGADSGLARADLLPRLTLNGNLTLSGTPVGASAFAPLGPLAVAGIGPSVTIPLLDWGQRRAVVDARDAAFRAAMEGYRQAILEGVEEVEVALTNAGSAQTRVGLLEQAFGRASQALRLSDALYRQGLATLLERLDAETALSSAQLELVTAREDALVAVVALHKAMGGAALPE